MYLVLQIYITNNEKCNSKSNFCVLHVIVSSDIIYFYSIILLKLMILQKKYSCYLFLFSHLFAISDNHGALQIKLTQLFAL
jgi:hypothetical protein